MVYCQNCGSENVDDAKFCVNCGAEIKKVTQKKQQLEGQPQKQEASPQPEQRKPIQLSTPSFLSRTTAMVTVIIIVAAVGFAMGLLIAESFDWGSGGGNHNPSDGDTITLSVQEFFDALEINIDAQNYTYHSNIKGVEDGDILRITGKIDQLMQHNASEIPAIGNYTSVLLHHNETTSLPVHAIGNLNAVFAVGDDVQVTLHPVELLGTYPDMTNTTWYLSGEFFQEQFIFGMLAFDLIVTPDQIKEV